jgi:hypothetical protein
MPHNLHYEFGPDNLSVSKRVRRCAGETRVENDSRGIGRQHD